MTYSPNGAKDNSIGHRPMFFKQKGGSPIGAKHNIL